MSNELQTMLNVLNNLTVIHSNIEKFGVTETLVDLVGDNVDGCSLEVGHNVCDGLESVMAGRLKGFLQSFKIRINKNPEITKEIFEKVKEKHGDNFDNLVLTKRSLSAKSLNEIYLDAIKHSDKLISAYKYIKNDDLEKADKIVTDIYKQCKKSKLYSITTYMQLNAKLFNKKSIKENGFNTYTSWETERKNRKACNKFYGHAQIISDLGNEIFDEYLFEDEIPKDKLKILMKTLQLFLGTYEEASINSAKMRIAFIDS